jgi:hypothetical protein
MKIMRLELECQSLSDAFSISTKLNTSTSCISYVSGAAGFTFIIYVHSREIAQTHASYVCAIELRNAEV